MKEAARIFNDIRIQSHKKLLIHAVGLVAVIATIAGLILGLAACPYLIPLALLVFGGGVSFLRYYLHLGLLETQGWHFETKRRIPEFTKTPPRDRPFFVRPRLTVLDLKLSRQYKRTRPTRLPVRPKLKYIINVRV